MSLRPCDSDLVLPLDDCVVRPDLADVDRNLSVFVGGKGSALAGVMRLFAGRRLDLMSVDRLWLLDSRASAEPSRLLSVSMSNRLEEKDEATLRSWLVSHRLLQRVEFDFLEQGLAASVPASLIRTLHAFGFVSHQGRGWHRQSSPPEDHWSW